jgi:cysteine-rich repeat protein
MPRTYTKRRDSVDAMRGNRAFSILALLVVAACGDNLKPSRPPEIASFQLTTSEDLPVTRALDATDPDGDPLIITFPVAPEHGTVTLAGTSITYSPAADYHGPDLFSVNVSDGTADATAIIDVTVTPVNDAPVGTPDSLAANEDAPRVVAQASLLQNDTDVDGDVLSILSVGSTLHGNVAITGTDVTFTPDPNFNGLAAFTYKLTDGTVTADILVTVTVGGANDAPIAVDDAATTAEDTPIDRTSATLVANDTDADGNTLSVTAVSAPTNGTVVLNGSTVTFTPTANFAGTATYTYTVSDGVAVDTGLVTITVTPVNDAPIAVDDLGTTAEDTPVDFTQATLVGNDVDVDGPSLSVTAVSNPVNGSVVLVGTTATFTPAANFSGTASFDYTVSDGTLSDTGTVNITVTSVNDAPVAIDDVGTTPEDTAIDFTTLTANDTDIDVGDVLTVTAVANATNGTVTLIGGSPHFTPAANFNGTASFEYTVSDGTLTDIGLVTITVTPVNDPPVAVDDAASVQFGNSIDIPIATLLANDTDVDGPALSITAVQNVFGGTATLNATTITFTPNAVGFPSFEYVVSDGSLTDVGKVNITASAGPVCGDGVIASPETCDDGNPNAGDGCSAVCQTEPGFNCAGEPSVCTTVCNDGIKTADEQCDDGNPIETDGCTTQCKTGVVCNSTAFPGGDRFAVDPATGHCYVSFDDEMTTFASGELKCVLAGGYLATITSAPEDALVHSVQNPGQNPWIGATDEVTEGAFDWVTDEPFGFSHFAAGEPDDDIGLGGNGDCLHLDNPAGEWADTNCNIATFVQGRICEIEPNACGDSILQSFQGEECDDSNNTSGDGCSATCQLEVGCGNGTLDVGEECDDDNVVSGDGCSASCTLEVGCGNGTLDVGEQCDDDNTVSGDGCSATCKFEGCGDGTVGVGEECDDNNRTSGDGCSATCQFEGCGDGVLDVGEQCDDDNRTPGDGCSATCTLENLVRFSFTGAVGDEATLPADAGDPGLSGIPVMSRGTGVAPSTNANTFSASGWTLTPVLDPTDFFSFTVTPNASMTLQILELDERRSGTGITKWSVRSSVDSFASDLQVFTVPDDTNTRVNQRIVLPAAFAGLSAAVEFRIFGFAAEAAGGTWRIDNVEVFGFTGP